MQSIEEQLIQFLSRFPHIRLALLFGSQASGESGFESDIDLALLMDTPIDAELRLNLIKSMGEEFGRSVDIVDLSYGAEPVMGQALQGKRLIGSDAAYADVLTKHLLNVADFVPIQQRILKERRDEWIN